MILDGWLMLPDAARGVTLRRGFVETHLGQIKDVRAGQPIFEPDLGSERAIICPGFIDAHVHLPQFDSIGAAGMTLLDWLHAVVFPAEARWADAEFAAAMTRRVIRQFLCFGTTSFAAYATSHATSAQAAIREVGRAGLRALVGQVLMDREAPAALLRPAKKSIEDASRLTLVGRCSPAVSPRFAITCSPDLLHLAARLSSATGQVIQTHLAETRQECEWIGEQFGMPYTDVYARAGLLTRRSVLGHGVWLSDAERATLARAGSIIAHCPSANDFLGAGAMDRRATIAAGVRLALGSDVAGGPDRSMVRVARAMAETARRLGHAPPSAGECFAQITSGNASALGFEDAGAIEPGRSADLLVIEPDIEGVLPPGDPLALERLLYAWDDRWLRATVVRGEVVYRSAVMGSLPGGAEGG